MSPSPLICYYHSFFFKPMYSGLMLCSVVAWYQCFRGSCCLYLHPGDAGSIPL